MKHKYKVIRFVNDEQVCEWKEEEINPILYLNDFYNFIDKEKFDGAWGHGQGSKDEIYNVLKKHLKALGIAKKVFDSSSTYTNKLKDSLECGWITQEEYELLKEVLDL